MKPIDKQELFDHLHSFLKSKGVELHEGSYRSGVQTACSLLADAVNLGQQGIERARTEVDKKLDQMRQYVHEQTAPRSKANPPPPEPQAEPERAGDQPRRKSRKKSPDGGK